jgi:hypothetical protein
LSDLALDEALPAIAQLLVREKRLSGVLQAHHLLVK